MRGIPTQSGTIPTSNGGILFAVDTVPGTITESFESYAAPSDLASASEWTETTAGGASTSDWEVLATEPAHESQHAESAVSAYRQAMSRPGNEGGLAYPDPTDGVTIRLTTYHTAGWFDLGFAIPDNELLNDNCYRVRGGTGFGNTIIRRTVDGTSTALETSSETLPANTWLDHAIEMDPTSGGGTEVGLTWTCWEWDDVEEEWSVFDTLSTVDTDNAFPAEAGVGFASNDVASERVSIDFLRWFSDLGVTGSPVGAPGSMELESGTTPANFAVTVTGTNSPVFEGSTLEVDAMIENTGSSSGTQTIRLEIDGVEEDQTSLELVGNQTDTVTLEWDTVESDAGSSTATVLSDDDQDSTTVQVDEAPDIVIIDSFEDPNDLDHYALSDATEYDHVSVPSPLDGSNVLEGTRDFADNEVSTTGLSEYFTEGSTGVFYVRTTNEVNARQRLYFNWEDADNTWGVRVHWDDDTLELARHLDGSVLPVRYEEDVGLSADTWYEVLITRDDGTVGGDAGDWTLEISDHDTSTRLVRWELTDITPFGVDGHGWLKQITDGQPGFHYWDYFHKADGRALSQDKPPGVEVDAFTTEEFASRGYVEVGGTGTNDYRGQDSTFTAGPVTGTFCMDLSGDFQQVINTEGSGLPYYPQRGDVLHWYWFFRGGLGRPEMWFGLLDEDDHYAVRLRANNNEFELRKYDGGTSTTIASDTVTYSTGEWYDVRVIWEDGTLGYGSADDIICELYALGDVDIMTHDHDSVTPLAVAQSNDSTHASRRGIGWNVGLDISGPAERELQDWIHVE